MSLGGAPRCFGADSSSLEDSSSSDEDSSLS